MCDNYSEHYYKVSTSTSLWCVRTVIVYYAWAILITQKLSFFLSLFFFTFFSIPSPLSSFSLSQTKFNIEPSDTKGKEDLIKSYLEGLAWVLTYYHDGTIDLF